MGDLQGFQENFWGLLRIFSGHINLKFSFLNFVRLRTSERKEEKEDKLASTRPVGFAAGKKNKKLRSFFGTR